MVKIGPWIGVCKKYLFFVRFCNKKRPCHKARSFFYSSSGVSFFFFIFDWKKGEKKKPMSIMTAKTMR